MTVNPVLTFPHDPVLLRLLIAAKTLPVSQTFIHDACGFEKTYLQLMGDILQTRSLLRARLTTVSANEHSMLGDDHRYIGLFSTSAYEFLVAFFAIRSIGGAPVILSSGILPEEAYYLLSKANARFVYTGRDCLENAANMATYMNSHTTFDFILLPISSTADPLSSMDAVRIDETLHVAAEGPGAVLLTSGTTGRPKMVVLPRQCFAYPELAAPGSATINYRPTHWVGGTRCLLKAAVTGVKIHAMDEKSSSDAILETMEKHRITTMSFSPMTLRRLKTVLISKMESSPQVEYASWFSGLTVIRCGGSMVDSSTMEFWSKLTGLPFQIFYSATELGGPSIKGYPTMPNSIGTPGIDVKVKLSEGSHGEILVKSSRMLTHYLGDEKATRDLFDENGYYKTGDVAELNDGQYIFDGRANSDFIIYRSYKIPALRVENALLDLPYISEACVLGIPHSVAKELCGAIVRLGPDAQTGPNRVTLERIRSDLAKILSTYMLPTLFRVLGDNERLPLTSIGKPIKKEIRKTFFKTTHYWPIENPPLAVEHWVNSAKIGNKDLKRPWDWCGMQTAG